MHFLSINYTYIHINIHTCIRHIHDIHACTPP